MAFVKAFSGNKKRNSYACQTSFGSYFFKARKVKKAIKTKKRSSTKYMKALVIAAHGSRKKESALEVAALTEKLVKKAKPGFDLVVHGFLQFSDPFLPGVIESVVKAGADTVVVFPFFISAGSHILIDIPDLVRGFAVEYPDVDFSISRHLGAVHGIEDTILKAVQNEC